MPVEDSELTFDILQVLQVYKLLKSTVDGFSGLYTGKDLSLIEYLFKLHEVPQDLQAVYLGYIMLIDEDNIAYYAKKKANKTNGK